jgi:hypothetical protein
MNHSGAMIRQMLADGRPGGESGEFHNLNPLKGLHND